jgi:hypothetical protein
VVAGSGAGRLAQLLQAGAEVEDRGQAATLATRTVAEREVTTPRGRLLPARSDAEEERDEEQGPVRCPGGLLLLPRRRRAARGRRS